MKEVDPLAALHAFVERFKTQRDAAEALDISQPYLHDMLNGNRRISPTILAQLGLRQVVVPAKAS